MFRPVASRMPARRRGRGEGMNRGLFIVAAVASGVTAWATGSPWFLVAFLAFSVAAVAKGGRTH